MAWDAAGELTDFDFTSLVGDDGTASYTYDDTGQITDADYDYQTDETYTYDSNGNRTITGYTTGDHNRLLTDGTYTYQYDNEGNRTARFVDNDSSGTLNSGDTSITEYEWDHRNRLTKVTERSTYGGAATKIVEYAYDYGQRWVRKTLDTDADGTIEESRVFVHDSGQIVLDFQKTGTGDAGNSDLAHRYLWGTNTDDLLADETVDDGTADDVAWALTDHLGSVRDLVVYDPVTQSVSVVKHVVYDAYGNVTSDTAAGVGSLFLYTARPLDTDTELQNNAFRWYDLSTGRWMSADRIGFLAGDVNLYRYVNNCPLTLVDPCGCDDADPHPTGWEMVYNHVDIDFQEGDALFGAVHYTLFTLEQVLEQMYWTEVRRDEIEPFEVGQYREVRGICTWEWDVFRHAEYRWLARSKLYTSTTYIVNAKVSKSYAQNLMGAAEALLNAAGTLGGIGVAAGALSSGVGEWAILAGLGAVVFDTIGDAMSPGVHNRVENILVDMTWSIRTKLEVRPLNLEFRNPRKIMCGVIPPWHSGFRFTMSPSTQERFATLRAPKPKKGYYGWETVERRTNMMPSKKDGYLHREY